MRRSIILPLVLTLLSSLLFLGDVPVQPVIIMNPAQPDSISYDQEKLLLVSILKEISPEVTISSQWKLERYFDISTREAKDNFVRDFYKLMGSRTTLQSMSYSFQLFNSYTKPETLTFAYADTMTLRKLWQRPEFAKFVREVQKSSDASAVLLNARGWADSSYAATYDDPVAENRTLYKFHVRLIPGVNEIYIVPAAGRDQKLQYMTTLASEPKATTDRPVRFHNSPAEENCSSCHEGLPSAVNGDTMTADCASCHKGMAAGSLYQHSPAEMKECSSCHEWSREQHAVVVAKSTPATCYDCHSEKQTQVENSAYPHAVAGECVTCHSPHGSDQKYILKQDVYSLCTGCHEDQMMNHPVGRHPLRFSKLANGEPISCVSCHNPHGSENEALLTTGGGRMESCSQCH